MTHDGPPPRHLHPVDPEPPYDPAYDRPTDTRTPPQDMAAEQSVLGSMLIDTNLIDDITTELLPNDFYRPIHETIYTAITALHHRGEPVDPITTADELNTMGELARIGGATYLHTLTAGVVLPAHAPHHAQIVRNAARLRVIVDTGTKLTQLGYTADITKIDAYLGDAVQALDDTVLRYGPTTAQADTGLTDMSWILEGKLPEAPAPAWARRTDDTALFYAGRVNGLFGDPDAAKTWLAMIAGIEALKADQDFAFVDVDHNGKDHTAGRLLLLGARPEHLADPDRFRYYEPEEAHQLRAAITDITTRAPAVVVLDSIGEILPMLGVKSVDNDEISGALRTIAMPPAKAGSCVITIDHLPKGIDARASGYAIGGTAKKRAMDGAYLRVEAKQKPQPGGIGRMVLRIEKDRTGELKRTSGGGYAGTFTLDSTQPRVTTWTIGHDDSPIDADGRFRPTGVMEQTSKFIEDNDQCTFNAIKDGVTAQDKTIRAAIKILVEEGFVSIMAGSQRRQLHHSISHYRETEDDHTQHDD